MKIASIVSGTSRNRTDQWVTSRCEGRAAINVGFGFSLLGHEVDIVNPVFAGDNASPMPGVVLKNRYDHNKEYDFVFIWNANKGSFPFTNYKRLIYMVEPSMNPALLRQKATDFPKALLCTASRKAVPLVKTNSGLDITYFPILYPIPCLPGITKQDFQDFNFDKNKKDINVWIFIDSWPRYHINCDQKILFALRRLRDHHGYKMKSTLHRRGDNPNPKDVSTIISEFKPTIIDSANICYLDVLNILSSMDICITKGGASYAGNCAFDIISLGKLMIYATEGCNSHNINDIYPLDNFVLRQEDDDNTIYRKVDGIISDPLACYTAMKNELITYSFPVWGKMVTEIIKALNIT